MFAEFERDISKIIDNDGALTSEKLSNMYYDLNKFYFGDNVYVDDEITYSNSFVLLFSMLIMIHSLHYIIIFFSFLLSVFR